MRNRFSNFMDGRYGNDQLNSFLTVAALVLLILNLFVTIWFLWYIGIILLVWAIWRSLSRNTARRAVENDRFTGFFSRFRRGGGSQSSSSGQSSYSRQESAERKKAQRQDKRYYRYFNCPNCNQKVRVPKGKGKIEITCPKCRTSFIRKT
ncbi:MAG: zinc-ribbon domain-containing protein [Lachnospiraceae bacterium]|nr:zinc-ribbon domain-containing protein [Lachnospiraceae bacterium]